MKFMIVGTKCSRNSAAGTFPLGAADEVGKIRRLFTLLVLLFALLFVLPEGARADTIQYRTLAYVDKQGIGIEAFRVLIPSEWQFNGGIRWVLDNPALPAVAAFRIFNPARPEEVEVFPNRMYFWSNNQTVQALHPVSSRYFGSEVRPIVNPVDYIQHFLIPRHRGKVSTLGITQRRPLPELARMVGAGMDSQPGLTTSAEGGMVRIEYQCNGRLIEEEIYAVVESFTYPVQTSYGPVYHTNWLGDYLFSFRAQKGELEASSKIFKTIVSSFRINPLWWSKYSQVVEMLIQMQIQRIKHIGQLGSIIARTGSEIRESDYKAWEKRQKIYDRLTTDFCQHIRGVDEYYDPVAGKPVELPSGYTRGWTNGLGDYIVTDSPSFDPNLSSSQDWQEMKRGQ
jgi:hypothetical protein